MRNSVTTCGGKVWIGYTPSETLKTRYKIEGRDDMLKTMVGALETFASAAAKRRLKLLTKEHGKC